MNMTMCDILPAWTTGEAMGQQNLSLVPLWGEGHQHRFEGYLLASEAIGNGLLSVTEVSDSGSVPQLLATNQADRPILLIDGEELQGAKQNRILNTTVLLPANTKTTIPVSCVEEGRWNQESVLFQSGDYAPSSLRRRKSRSVQASLRSRGQAESDQGEVWDCVREHIAEANASSPTRAMSDAISSQRALLQGFQEALPCPTGASGVLAAVNGHFIAVDAFDSPETLDVLWPRLIASYAADAVRNANAESEKTFTAKAAKVVLEHIAEQQCQAFDSAGRGKDLRFEAEDLLGQALAVDSHLLHLSVFPTEESRRQANPDVALPPMRSPSQRRRNRHRETE